MPRHRVPSYRFHKATGQAVVVLRGESVYLGKFGSPASKALYDQVIAKYLSERGQPEQPATPIETRLSPFRDAGCALSISELVLKYWTFAKSYYVKNGQPTGELPPLKEALRVLRRQAGETPAAEFGPIALKSVREVLMKQPNIRRLKVTDPETGEPGFTEKVIRVGLARRTINKQIGRIKRVFAWAVAEELLPPHVHEALRRVEGLRHGRSVAREKARITSVADKDVDAVLSHVPSAIAAMIRVQRLTGCRPQEVVLMRGIEIVRTNAIWEYRPGRHKMEHRNEDGDTDKERVVFIGPKAQAVLEPFLAGARGGYVFSPKRIEHERVRHLRGVKPRPRRDHYSVAAYRQEIQRGCKRAGVSKWCPLQLRHTSATMIRKQFGVERAQAVLGHSEIGVTQVYAEVDRDAARSVMAELG